MENELGVPDWDTDWKPDKEETVVLFRMWRPPECDYNGKKIRTKAEVIAIFPEMPSSTRNWYECDSYQRVGQHSGCDYELVIVPTSRPAKPDEYAALKKELESYPYGYKLKVMQRMTPQMRENREKNWKEIMTVPGVSVDERMS